MKRLVALLLLAAPLCAHAEVYKCTQGGKTQYQDTPCAGAATGAALKIRENTPSASSDANAPSDVDRINAWRESNEREREKASLDRQIKNAEIDRADLQKKMDGELAALKIKKLYAKNNLAGATWEQSISTEMQAVTTKYDAQLRAADATIADLKAQRAKYD